MKKIIALLLLSAGIAQAYSQAPMTGPYKLVITLKNIPEAARARLFYPQGKTRCMDSVPVINGRCTFTGVLKEPAVATLMLDKAAPDKIRPYIFNVKNTLEFYLASGTTTIDAGDSLLNTPCRSNSPYTADYTSFTEGIKAYRAKYLAPLYPMLRQYKDQPEQLKQVKQQIDDANEGLRETAYKQFILDHASSPVAMEAYRKYARFIVTDTLEQLFRHLSPAVQVLPSGLVYEELFKGIHRVRVGSPAPDFSSPDTAGNIVRLSSYRGKYVLIDFWASWCHPCRLESPNLVAAFKAFGQKNFMVLGVSVDTKSTRTAWLKAIQLDGLPWTNLCDLTGWNTGVAQLYGINQVPQNFLISPEGKVVAINLHGEALQQKLKELL